MEYNIKSCSVLQEYNILLSGCKKFNLKKCKIHQHITSDYKAPYDRNFFFFFNVIEYTL